MELKWFKVKCYLCNTEAKIYVEEFDSYDGNENVCGNSFELQLICSNSLCNVIEYVSIPL